MGSFFSRYTEAKVTLNFTHIIVTDVLRNSGEVIFEYISPTINRFREHFFNFCGKTVIDIPLDQYDKTVMTYGEFIYYARDLEYGPETGFIPDPNIPKDKLVYVYLLVANYKSVRYRFFKDTLYIKNPSVHQ